MAVELGIDEPETLLRARSAQRIGVSEDDIGGVQIARRAVDARRRGRTHDVRFVDLVDLLEYQSKPSHISLVFVCLVCLLFGCAVTSGVVSGQHGCAAFFVDCNVFYAAYSICIS